MRDFVENRRLDVWEEILPHIAGTCRGELGKLFGEILIKRDLELLLSERSSFCRLPLPPDWSQLIEVKTSSPPCSFVGEQQSYIGTHKNNNLEYEKQ